MPATQVPLPPAYFDPDAYSKEGRSYLDLDSCSIEDEAILDDCDQEIGEDGIVRLTYPQRLYIKGNARFSRITSRRRTKRTNARYTRAIVYDGTNTPDAPPVPALPSPSTLEASRPSSDKKVPLEQRRADEPSRKSGEHTPGSSLDSMKVNPSSSPPAYEMHE